MSTPAKLTVGQKLWFVPREKRTLGDSREVTVTRVGRSWADADGIRGYRIGIADLIVDEPKYGGIGQCYVSREAYEIEHARDVVWDALQGRLRSWVIKRHPDVTVEDMKAACKLLRI